MIFMSNCFSAMLQKPTLKMSRKTANNMYQESTWYLGQIINFCNVTEPDYQNTLNKSKQCTRRVHEIEVKLFFCNVYKSQPWKCHDKQQTNVPGSRRVHDLWKVNYFSVMLQKVLMGLVQVRTKWCKVGEFNQKASVCLQPSKLQRKRRWVTMVWVGYHLGEKEGASEPICRRDGGFEITQHVQYSKTLTTHWPAMIWIYWRLVPSRMDQSCEPVNGIWVKLTKILKSG